MKKIFCVTGEVTTVRERFQCHHREMYGEKKFTKPS
jgi:hypothetical protein